MKVLLVLALASLAIVSCNKKEDKDDDILSPTPTPTPAPMKDTLSSWSRSSGLWFMRLDLNGANLQGTPFNMIVKCADTSEITCTGAVLAGSEGNGSYQSGTCAVSYDPSPGLPDSMAAGFLPAFQHNTAGGTYTNNGTTFTFCRNVANCFSHQ